MKIITKLMAGLCLVSLSYMPSQAQQFQSHEQLMRNLLEVQQINAMNGALPQNHSSKTTSPDRVIKSMVDVVRTDYNSWVDAEYDSVDYVNFPGQNSELRYSFLLYRPVKQLSDLDVYSYDGTKFAGQIWTTYKADTSLSYDFWQSDSIHYDTDGKILFYKTLYYNGDYNKYDYTYDASGRLSQKVQSHYDFASSTYDYIYTTDYRYGTGYRVYERSPAAQYDSVIFDSNGRVAASFRNTSTYSLYTYDSNGRTSTSKSFTFNGSITDSTIYSFNDDYRSYQYTSYTYSNGSINNIYDYKLVDQGGQLDSIIYQAKKASSGNILILDQYDITLDSYGNITKAEIYNKDGFMSAIKRFHYEDVILSSDQPLAFTEFKVFPNPATSDVLHISTTEKYNSLALYNTDGQLLMQTHFGPRTESQITLSDLAPGSYVVTVRSDEGRLSSQTIVVQR